MGGFENTCKTECEETWKNQHFKPWNQRPRRARVSGNAAESNASIAAPPHRALLHWKGRVLGHMGIWPAALPLHAEMFLRSGEGAPPPGGHPTRRKRSGGLFQGQLQGQKFSAFRTETGPRMAAILLPRGPTKPLGGTTPRLLGVPPKGELVRRIPPPPEH